MDLSVSVRQNQPLDRPSTARSDREHVTNPLDEHRNGQSIAGAGCAQRRPRRAITTDDRSQRRRPVNASPSAWTHQVYRLLYLAGILFAFDPWRSSILLVAGDKAGRWNDWYADAIPLAEHRSETYLKERAEEQGRQP